MRELCSQKPLHVINATLNLVKGKELAWQERLAESFTMSPLHCGSPRVGYRPSAKYGKGIQLVPRLPFRARRRIPIWAITPHPWCVS